VVLWVQNLQWSVSLLPNAELARGAIACIGTATNSTTLARITHGLRRVCRLYDEGITQAGNVLNRAKIELYNAYQTNDPQSVIDFSNYAALAGDPVLNSTREPSIYDSSFRTYLLWNAARIDCQSNGMVPCRRRVCLYKTNELQVIGETDSGVSNATPGIGFIGQCQSDRLEA